VTKTGAGSKWDWGPLDGNPQPDIKTGQNFSSFGSTNQITVTEIGGGEFTFNSVQLDSNDTTLYYTIIGYLGSTQEFDISCTTGNCGLHNTWTTIGGPADYVNDVVITLTDNNSDGIDRLDNIGVTSTPEPNSLILLGSGMLGLAGVLRRKLGRG
jgi:hypothetical protein